jgi:hypothetical protein
MALGSRKSEEAFAAMLDDLDVSRAARARQEGGADADALMGDIVSRLQALPSPAGGMPADARAKLMAIAATELPTQAAERRAAAAAAAAPAAAPAGAPAATAAPAQRPSPRPRPRPVPAARPAAHARPRFRISERFSLPSWTPLATGAVAAVVAVTGVGVAVSRSLPDSWLHDKNTTSTIRLNGAQSNAALNKLNDARGEMNALLTAAYNDARTHNGTVSSAAADKTRSALTHWAQTSAAGTTPLLQSAKAGDVAARESLLTYTSQEVGGLSRALPTLPASVKAQAQQEIAKLQGINAALAAPPAPAG